MTLKLNASNAYLSGSIDLTASPQLLLTNSSTYTEASLLSAVTTEEVSGSGYARPTLTVQSNSITPGGDSTLIYNLATITASGGAITFDRAVLVANGNWVGYWDYGSTQTIANGTTKPFRGLTITRSDSGALINGSNGDPAYTNTTANFTQPIVGGTVTVSMVQTNFIAVGSVILINDGTNKGTYEVTAIGSPQSATLERLEQGGSAPDGSTIASGALVVVSGATTASSDFSSIATFGGNVLVDPLTGNVVIIPIIPV